MKRNRALLVLFLGLLILAALFTFARRTAAPQEALSGGRETQLVYRAWAETGEKYREVIYPQSTDTVYLLANIDNALIPSLTEVYYWAPTLDYRADFTAMDRRYDAVLEIRQGGRVIAELDMEPFAIIYDRTSPKELAFGPDAEQSYASFQEESAAVAEELDAYYLASAEYQLAFEKYLEEIRSGNLNAQRPEEPTAEPPVIRRYVSKPEPAFHLNLPPGDYELRMLTADKTRFVETSQKKLHVFAPRREGAGYRVFVEERWRQQVVAADPNAPIYIRRGSQVFLEPYYAQEFNRYDYSRLLSPQQPAAGKDSWEWVLSYPIEDARLLIQGEGDAVHTFDSQPYIVEQTSDTSLGYSILPFEASEEASPAEEVGGPDFSAFRISGDSEFANARFFLVGPDGAPIRGSERRIAALPAKPDWPLYLMALAPLVLGAVTIGYRKRRTVRLAKLEEM